MITFLVRVFVLVCTVVAYWCTFMFMENLDKNPLAQYGIWGMASAVGISFAVIYLINVNKDEKRANEVG